MATKKNDSKKVVYSEPKGYIPKDIYDKYFKEDKSKDKKPATKKPTGKKK